MTKLLWIFIIGALSVALALPAPVSFHLIDVKERLFTASPGPPPQEAPLTFHLIDINEVYSNADGTLQFVELLATFVGQTQIAQTRVTSFNGTGATETVVFDFTANFPGLGRNQTILLATPAFEAIAGFAPNFVIPERSLSLADGRVVFKTDSGSQIVDAVAYGRFTGNNAGFGSPTLALPHDGTNSLTRRSNTRNNANDFVIAPSSPLRQDGRSAMIRGGQYMLALLSDTDEIIRFELATGNIVQRVPAGFDVENASGIDLGTATGVHNGNPFVVVTQVGQAVVRLYDAVTLMQFDQFQKGPNDIGWDGVAFDGANWIFSVPDGVMGDATFQGVDLINLSASINTDQVVKFASLNLNTPNQPFDVTGGIGWTGPGVAVVSGFTGMNPALAQITINNNTLTRGPTIAVQAGGAQPGVSGRLITIGAGHILISVPGSADLRIINPRTGQPVRTLTINEVDFTDDVTPNNAIAGLSSETTIAGP